MDLSLHQKAEVTSMENNGFVVRSFVLSSDFSLDIYVHSPTETHGRTAQLFVLVISHLQCIVHHPRNGTRTGTWQLALKNDGQ